jgi:hypothetical protein
VPRPVFINRYRNVDDYVVAGGTTAENRGGRNDTGKAASDQGLIVAGYRPYRRARCQ